jgi:hypothetical protein
MVRSEYDILAIFRSYRVGPNKMLFLNGFVNDQFTRAMRVLVDKKLVVKDRREHAYYLTPEGYTASLQCQSTGPAPTRRVPVPQSRATAARAR